MEYIISYLIAGAVFTAISARVLGANGSGYLVMLLSWPLWSAVMVWVALRRWINPAITCGWCGAEFKTKDEIRAHTVICEQNPLVEQMREERSANERDMRLFLATYEENKKLKEALGKELYDEALAWQKRDNYSASPTATAISGDGSK